MKVTMATLTKTNLTKSGRNARRKSAWRDTRGAVMVEYALLLTFVAVPTIVGFTIAGGKLLTGYVSQRDFLLLPTP